MWWTSSSGKLELKMTLAQAQSVSHQGQCDEDVVALLKTRAISWQVSNLDPKQVRNELREYGAWDAEELADHDANLQRLVWIAGCDINERHNKRG